MNAAPRSLELIRQLVRLRHDEPEFQSRAHRLGARIPACARHCHAAHARRRQGESQSFRDDRRPAPTGHRAFRPYRRRARRWTGMVGRSMGRHRAGRPAARSRRGRHEIVPRHRARGRARRCSARSLATPIHLAFSYDEEVGCIGVGRMIRDMQDIGVAPGICIVGEPTEHEGRHRAQGQARVARARVRARGAFGARAVRRQRARIRGRDHRRAAPHAARGRRERPIQPRVRSAVLDAARRRAARRHRAQHRAAGMRVRFRVPHACRSDDPHRLLGTVAGVTARRRCCRRCARVAPESGIALRDEVGQSRTAHGRARADRRPHRAARAAADAAARSRSRRRRGNSSAPASTPSSAVRARSPTRTSRTNSSRSIRFARARRSSPVSSKRRAPAAAGA